jgi:site-specific recombinase XerD
MKARNRADRTEYIIKQSLELAEKRIGKPLENATYDEILSYIESLKVDFADNTVALHYSKLIQFYKFCFDETDDIRYNKLVKRLKSLSLRIKSNHISPTNILLPEDIKRLINVSTLERDRCIVATLFESGMRVGELRALTNNMIMMNEQTQEVTFNIPDIEGCKTGGRTVVCLEIYGYVQDWMKCNTSEMFIPVSNSGIRKTINILFKKAGISKPCNPHMFRHSAITHAVNIGMQQNAICERFWGRTNSNMLSTYIHLSEQMQSNAYRTAKGMNGDDTKVINPIALRCVECGKLIQSGKLCKQCEETANLKRKVQEMESILSVVARAASGGDQPNELVFDGEKVRFRKENEK